MSLSVRAGEIVGVAGVTGSGQADLVAAITGSTPIESGSIRLCGRDITGLSVRDRRARGLAHIPENRAEVGFAAAASLADNLATGFHRDVPLARRGLLRRSALRAHAEEIVRRLSVRTRGIRVPLRTLSRADQQKAIVGRELAHHAPLLVVEQPTRGVDVGSVERIHAELVSYRDAGNAVLLVSAEIGEILKLSDRVLVLRDGHLVAEFDRTQADARRVEVAMVGADA